MHGRAAETAAKLAARREAALDAVRRPALNMSVGSRRLLAAARAGFFQRLQVTDEANRFVAHTWHWSWSLREFAALL